LLLLQPWGCEKVKARTCNQGIKMEMMNRMNNQKQVRAFNEYYTSGPKKTHTQDGKRETENMQTEHHSQIAR